jgi:hypothetical protein
VTDRRYSPPLVKRLALFLIMGIIVVIALVYAVRLGRHATKVSSLLPQETIAFLHVPDFNRTRDEWRRSDIYQLIHEPAVEQLLRKPLARLRKRNTQSPIFHDLEQLVARDIFIAVTSIEARNTPFVAGFRFRGNRDAAAAIIDKWRTQFLSKTGNAKEEKIAYRQHDIAIVVLPAFTVATAYDRQWFFVSNDIDRLKELLDRADGRSTGTATQSAGAQNRQSSLQSNNAFRAAIAHMPSDYAALAYLEPKMIADKVAAIRAALGVQIAPADEAPLHRITSICGSARFEHGKIHDVLFTGMDQPQVNASVTRSATALGSSDTFFYLTTLIDPNNWTTLGTAAGFTPVASWMDKFLRTLAARGVTIADWNTAFGPELSSLADWPQNAHWPSFILAVPVKNRLRANQLADVITTAIDEDGRWVKSEKDGISYFSKATPLGLFSVAPTIALSNRLLMAGLDPASVEAAIKRSDSSAAGISNSQTYTAAARSLPAATNFFAYIDTSLLYSRLDAALRPILLLGAAFLPALADHVDPNKLPAAETVTKHLSPIVFSQRYDRDGYVAESIGTITFGEAVIAAFATATLSGHQPSTR